MWWTFRRCQSPGPGCGNPPVWLVTNRIGGHQRVHPPRQVDKSPLEGRPPRAPERKEGYRGRRRFEWVLRRPLDICPRLPGKGWRRLCQSCWEGKGFLDRGSCSGKTRWRGGWRRGSGCLQAESSAGFFYFSKQTSSNVFVMTVRIIVHLF